MVGGSMSEKNPEKEALDLTSHARKTLLKSRLTWGDSKAYVQLSNVSFGATLEVDVPNSKGLKQSYSAWFGTMPEAIRCVRAIKKDIAYDSLLYVIPLFVIGWTASSVIKALFFGV
jgi:hypothetical protein